MFLFLAVWTSAVLIIRCIQKYISVTGLCSERVIPKNYLKSIWKWLEEKFWRAFHLNLMDSYTLDMRRYIQFGYCANVILTMLLILTLILNRLCLWTLVWQKKEVVAVTWGAHSFSFLLCVFPSSLSHVNVTAWFLLKMKQYIMERATAFDA